MDNQDQFEKKIKEKLEEISMPDLDQAWEKFAPMLTAPKIPFWKHWSMPYLFAGTLFLISLMWNQREFNDTSDQISGRNVITTGDTLFVRDTVYLVDTVYLIKKVVRQEILAQTPTELKASNTLEMFESEKDIPTSADRANFGISKLTEAALPGKSAMVSPLRTESTNESATGSGLGNAVTNLASPASQERAEVTDSTGFGLADTKQIRRNMSAPSVVQEKKTEFRLEEELVIGDTSNLSEPPLSRPSKPMFQVEAINSILFPVSRLVEYYRPIQFGLQIGVEWENGWGVYAGAIRNRLWGELDDEEIMNLNPSILSKLPNIPNDIASLDEIFIKDLQWYFPLELRWRSLYYNGFSFEGSFGLLGNYLGRQDFAYEFEDDLIEGYQYGTVNSRQFGINHFRMGIGTHYIFSKRLGVFLRTHYWLPVFGKGLINDRMHGIEVGTGITFLFGK